MSSRPTLKELIAQRQADIASRFGDAVYRSKGNLNVMARVFAAGEHGVYGYLDYIAQQLFPDSCSADILLRIASFYQLSIIPAQYASGTILVTGNIGAQLDVTDRWQASNGQTYVVAEAITLNDSTATVSIMAEESGTDSNLESGATLTLINVVDGIALNATVNGDGITGGAAEETIDALRLRVQDRMAITPQGGNDEDYERWAKEAHPAVDKVWVSNEQGVGYVLVRFITKESSGGLIPTLSIVDTVDSYIQKKRPTTARVTVLAPVPVSQDFSIALDPDTSSVRQAVADALQDLLRRDAEPSGVLLRTHIDEAISTATGEYDHSLVSPSSNVAYDLGEYPVMGDITWL